MQTDPKQGIGAARNWVLSKFNQFPRKSAKNTFLNLSNLANLAKAPAIPEEVKIDVKGLTNFSHLFWKAPKTGNAKGYHLLSRETTSHVWQKKIFCPGNANSTALFKRPLFFCCAIC